MDLPPTYYDFIRKLRPELVEISRWPSEQPQPAADDP